MGFVAVVFHCSAARELPDVSLEHSRQVDKGFGSTPHIRAEQIVHDSKQEKKIGKKKNIGGYLIFDYIFPFLSESNWIQGF